MKWTANRKHITFITPEGYRCRDNSLHDETFLKDNLEYLFLYRQLTNFEPGREEPSYGWLYGVTYNAEALTRYMAQAMDVPDPPPIPAWTESKQRQREALKSWHMGSGWRISRALRKMRGTVSGCLCEDSPPFFPLH